MTYADFTFEDISSRLALRVGEPRDLCSAHPPVDVTEILRYMLPNLVPLADEARLGNPHPEILAAPILLEVRWQLHQLVSINYNADFTVDAERGLAGKTGYIFNLSEDVWATEMPVIMIVETKVEDLNSRLPECAAQMAAARLFHQKAGRNPARIHGGVTNGFLWRFCVLEGDTVTPDAREYAYTDTEKIVGIGLRLLRESAIDFGYPLPEPRPASSWQPSARE